MKDQHRINYLLNKYLSEDISINEHDELFAMIASGGFDTIIGNRMEDEYNTLPMDGEAGLPPHVAQEIIRNIKLSDKHTEALLPTIALRRNRWIRWVAAASVILILVTGGLIYNQLEQEPVQENLSAIIPDDQLLKTSSSGKPVQVVLKDGSKVLLQPNSTLYYSTRFSDKKREVILDGEAFFTVKRDPSKPFLVFYHKIVTKVLGTSFNIRTNAQTKNLEVAVKTGKVQVFENQHFLPNGLNGKTVIVTPNQKAIYNNQMESLETALVDIPLPIAEKADAEDKSSKTKKSNHVYNRQHLMDIFKTLSDQYGIEIIPENENFSNCLFTGDLTNQDLYTKLKIICLTVNASYETIGTRIFIKGKGCN